MESTLGADLARLVRLWRALIDHRLKPLKLTQTHWVTLYNIIVNCLQNNLKSSWLKQLVLNNHH